METYSMIVNFFQNGGEFMYPIVLVLALGVAISVERWFFLTMTMRKNKALWNQVTPHLKAGNLQGAMQVTSKSDAAIAQIMTYGLNRVRSAKRREDVEQAMEESLMEIMPRLEKRTHYLATFANMATLMGLLGTIIGLIDAFTAVSNADPAEKAELLSASISVGMNCTAFGLMVAIPLVLVHSLLQTKTTEIVDSLEMASVKFLNAITERASGDAGPLPAAPAPTKGDSLMPQGAPVPRRA
jgi:biopolymer transport protein ExbB/TolQ